MIVPDCLVARLILHLDRGIDRGMDLKFYPDAFPFDYNPDKFLLQN